MNPLIETLPLFPISFHPQPAPPPDPVKPPSPSMPVLEPDSPIPQPSRPPLIEPSQEHPMIHDPTPPPSWRPVAWCGGMAHAC
jgi:hypothetical protein